MFVLLKVQSLQLSFRPAGVSLGVRLGLGLGLGLRVYCTVLLTFSSLQDLFKTVKPEVILDLLKAAALYRLL